MVIYELPFIANTIDDFVSSPKENNFESLADIYSFYFQIKWKGCISFTCL